MSDNPIKTPDNFWLTLTGRQKELLVWQLVMDLGEEVSVIPADDVAGRHLRFFRDGDRRIGMYATEDYLENSKPVTIVPNNRYRATIRIRRGEGWVVRPHAEVLDGKTAVFKVGWPFTPEDNSLYTHEWAMLPIDSAMRSLIGWIASGDLTDIQEVDVERFPDE